MIRDTEDEMRPFPDPEHRFPDGREVELWVDTPNLRWRRARIPDVIAALKALPKDELNEILKAIGE